jgi:hypothetical protein
MELWIGENKMEILDHTDDHQPTLMRDVYDGLVGEKVFVYVKGCGSSIAGKLAAYNGVILHVVGDNNINYYMYTDNVATIGSDK